MGKKRLKKSKVEAQPSVMTAAVPLSVETNEGVRQENDCNR
jgi:hypothetical protein